MINQPATNKPGNAWYEDEQGMYRVLTEYIIHEKGA
jgi:hypothetical protein